MLLLSGVAIARFFIVQVAKSMLVYTVEEITLNLKLREVEHAWSGLVHVLIARACMHAWTGACMRGQLSCASEGNGRAQRVAGLKYVSRGHPSRGPGFLLQAGTGVLLVVSMVANLALALVARIHPGW